MHYKLNIGNTREVSIKLSCFCQLNSIQFLGGIWLVESPEVTF